MKLFYNLANQGLHYRPSLDFSSFNHVLIKIKIAIEKPEFTPWKGLLIQMELSTPANSYKKFKWPVYKRIKVFWCMNLSGQGRLAGAL